MSRPLRLAVLAFMIVGSVVAGLGVIGSVLLMVVGRGMGSSVEVQTAVGAYGGFLLAFVMAPAAAWMAWKRGRAWIAPLFMLVPFAMIWGLIGTAGDI